MAQENKSISLNDIEIGLILLGVTVGAIFLLPPLIKILQLPGEILDLPGKGLDLLKKAANDTSSDAYSNSDTTIPGVSSESLAKVIDKQIFSNFNNVPIRQTANSNAAVVKYINSGDSPGYVYSAVNESLGGKNITWIAIEDTPNGSQYGYVRLTDINIDGQNSIGCINCNSNCNSCNKNISGINRIIN